MKKNRPKYSIIVPAYNVDCYIDECIESVLQQDYKDFELILVDDGSKDKTGEIIDKYAYHDHIVALHKKNGGLVSARQYGLSNSTGLYIMCLDGDDWLEPDLLSNIDKIILKFNPDITCFAHWRSKNKEQRQKVPVNSSPGFYNRAEIENKIFPYLIHAKDGKYFATNIWGKVFKRDVYQEYQMGVNPSISIGEDFTCVVPCIVHANSLYILEDTYYNYRVNMGSMTKAKKAYPMNGPEDIYKCLEKMIDLSKYDFEKQLNRKLTHNLFNICCSQFNSTESYKEIKRRVLSILNYPLYKRIVQDAAFAGGIKVSIMDFAMKHQLVFMLGILNKLRR